MDLFRRPWNPAGLGRVWVTDVRRLVRNRAGFKLSVIGTLVSFELALLFLAWALGAAPAAADLLTSIWLAYLVSYWTSNPMVLIIFGLAYILVAWFDITNLWFDRVTPASRPEPEEDLWTARAARTSP